MGNDKNLAVLETTVNGVSLVFEASAVVDLAIDVLGGRAYFRSSPLERAYRDVRAGTFHPFPAEVALTYAGKVALGDPGTGE